MWYAVYTKPRKQDSVALRLRNIGIEVLNPKLKSQKYRSKKFLEIIEPLFPCYLFADFEKDKYSHLITYTRGVRYVVGKTNPIIVPDEVIGAIREGIDGNNVVTVKPEKFKKGDKVVIREGPFKDFYGIFERETSSFERVIVLLSTLNCKVELDGCFLTVA